MLDAKVIVCAECLRACCWYGEFMCQKSRSANLKILTVGDLQKLNLEHPDYWTDATMVRIYGDASREFRV